MAKMKPSATMTQILELVQHLPDEEKWQLVNQIQDSLTPKTPTAEPPWTDEELEHLIQPDPRTGAEIVAMGLTGGWEHLDIDDGATWVNEQKAKRRRKNQW